jgi:hypothetical protein
MNGGSAALDGALTGLGHGWAMVPGGRSATRTRCPNTRSDWPLADGRPNISLVLVTTNAVAPESLANTAPIAGSSVNSDARTTRSIVFRSVTWLGLVARWLRSARLYRGLLAALGIAWEGAGLCRKDAVARSRYRRSTCQLRSTCWRSSRCGVATPLLVAWPVPSPARSVCRLRPTADSLLRLDCRSASRSRCLWRSPTQKAVLSFCCR